MLKILGVLLLSAQLIGCGVVALQRDQAASFDPQTRAGASCKVRCAENQQLGNAPPGAYAKCIEACMDVDRLNR